MCTKFSDEQLKVVSDSISKCLCRKNFLGWRVMPPDPLERLCFTHQDTTPLLPYDHAISEMANQIWF